MKIALGLFCVVFGVFAGELLARVPLAHDLAGRLFHRGHLIALSQGIGIYDIDEHVFRANKESRGEEQSFVEEKGLAIRRQLVATATLPIATQRLNGDSVEFERDFAALQSQFSDLTQFRAALRGNRTSEGAVKRLLLSTVGGERWLEGRIRARIAVSQDDAREYFENQRGQFIQPLRIHARHIFLAAPEGSAPELIEAKGRAMQDLVARLRRGEDFVQLAAASSEDEASKGRGGDLGFLAADRVPAEFFSAVEKIPANSPPVLVQTHLGFHAVQIMEVQASRAMTFEEALPEISSQISADKRRRAVDEIQSQLLQGARFFAREI